MRGLGPERTAAARQKLSALEAAWAGHEPTLSLEPGVFLELRFRKLDYPLIWKLQTDPLVDTNLTPQTQASIRIVLGTLADLVRR